MIGGAPFFMGPLMSYGGSAILVNLVAIAVVLRIDRENRTLMQGGRI